MPITLNGTTGIVSPALDSDSSLTVGPAVMDTPTGSAPLFACRAWVNFDGTKDTTGAVSTANTNRLIRGSGNVTSVLRNGTGDYTITLTTAMPDANYAMLVTGVPSNSGNGNQTDMGYYSTNGTNAVGVTTSAVRVLSRYGSTTSDIDTVSVAIFR